VCSWGWQRGGALLAALAPPPLCGAVPATAQANWLQQLADCQGHVPEPMLFVGGVPLPPYLLMRHGGPHSTGSQVQAAPQQAATPWLAQQRAKDGPHTPSSPPPMGHTEKLCFFVFVMNNGFWCCNGTRESTVG